MTSIAQGDGGREHGTKLSADPSGPPDGAQVTADPAHVFISYASPDAAVAKALVEDLERHGIACWIAPRNVDAGALYADSIVRAIGGAKAFVLVLSENSIDSSHVGKEVERASSKKRPIFTLRIDAAPLTPALEYFLSESQWIEAQAGTMEPAYAKLIGAIRKSAPTAPGTIPTVTPAAGTASGAHPRGRRNRILLAAGLAVAVLALGTLLADKFWLSKHAAAARPTTAAPNVVSEKSIAVLPFTDMSEKHDQEYFGDGMAEEILDLLAKIPGLTVIGRTSSFQFKGKNEDLRTIGTKLNAAYVLEGSVRNSGDQVRITAQLINTRTGAHEWSDTYDRHIGDVLKLQDAIAGSVARELQLTIAPEELNSHATVKSAEAYDLYLRGRHAFDRGDKEGLEEALMLFQRALDLDPTSTHAAGWIAASYSTQVLVGSLAPAAGFEQARRMATVAVKLDPNNARAYVAMAMIHLMYDWDWAGAERELQKATTLAPGDVEVLSGEAGLSATLGRWDDALRQSKAALSQDPLDANKLVGLSIIQMIRGNLQEAEAAMRRALEIRPSYTYGHYNLGLIFLERGDPDRALREMQQETINDGRQQGLALVYYALGRKADADAALAALIKEQADASALGIAQVYAFRGQSDEAMHWLERAYAQKDPYLSGIKGDWLFMKGLETDPRYKAFLRKMNLPE